MEVCVLKFQFFFLLLVVVFRPIIIYFCEIFFMISSRAFLLSTLFVITFQKHLSLSGYQWYSVGYGTKKRVNALRRGNMCLCLKLFPNFWLFKVSNFSHSFVNLGYTSTNDAAIFFQIILLRIPIYGASCFFSFPGDCNLM